MCRSDAVAGWAELGIPTDLMAAVDAAAAAAVAADGPAVVARGLAEVVGTEALDSGTARDGPAVILGPPRDWLPEVAGCDLAGHRSGLEILGLTW
jgi:hypothetical protein